MRRRSNRYLLMVACTAVLWILWTFLSFAGNEELTSTSRKSRATLADEGELIECIPSGFDAFPGDFMSQEQRKKGGIVVHILIVCYVCAMTAIVCDEFFVPSLEVIAEKLKLSPDVAGATFMAMGASAPELFSSLAGSFVTENDIGLGTILGSAVFNILGISGVVGLVLWEKVLPIRWYPVVRDCIVYTLTVLVLSYIIVDNIVRWWEALILVLIFCSYIIFMNFNTKVEKFVSDSVRNFQTRRGRGQLDIEKEPLLKKVSSGLDGQENIGDIISRPNGNSDGHRDDEEEDANIETDCFCSRVWHVVMWLPTLLFRLTIPPVKWYPATFIFSIVWMGGLSYIAVWMVTIIGFTFSIPDSVSGLTLLAAGSSVPDLIATVIVAKSGKGNMAISNLLGSNTFDLAFCLGAPWFIKTLTTGQGKFLVYSSTMVYTVCTLLVTLVALLTTFQLNGWRMNRTAGMVFLTLYVICITLACLYELNVFGEINKPTCY